MYNIRSYIELFRDDAQTRMREHGDYCLTNITSAVTYLKDLDVKGRAEAKQS